MLQIEDDDKDDDLPTGMHWRFSPVISVGNIISLIGMSMVIVGGLWGIYTAFRSDIDATNNRLTAQQIIVATLQQTVKQNSDAIAQDRIDAKQFNSEMRDRLDRIAEQISSLREDLARDGVRKTR